MAARSSWPAQQFLALGKDAGTVLERLVELPADDRAAAIAGFDKALPRLLDEMPPAALMVVAADLGASPTQVERIIQQGLLGYLFDNPQYHQFVLDRFISLGPEWATALERKLPRRDVDWFHAWLLDELVISHDLPLPTHAGFWREWNLADVLPKPGRRWQDHFIALCAVPNGLGWPPADASGFLARVRESTAQLRAAEKVDDVALLRALIEVMARGDGPGPQRMALLWAEGLGIDTVLWEHPELWLAALPNADTTFISQVVAKLPQLTLDDQHLTAIVAEVLARPQKGPRRSILKELSRVTAPSAELLEVVEAAAHDLDATVSSRANKLLQRWGHDETSPQLLGLWQLPSGGNPSRRVAPLKEPELWAELSTALADFDEDEPALHERLLAGLIELGWTRGCESVLSQCEALLTEVQDETDAMDAGCPPGCGCRSILAELIERICHEARTGESNVWASRAPLTEFVSWHAYEALNAIGKVPCLLSTPTHHGNRLSWQELQERVQRYIECDQPLMTADLLVALARVDGNGNWEGIANAVVGETKLRLRDVLEVWQQPVSAAELRLWEASESEGPQMRGVEVVGEYPQAAELMRCGSAWSWKYRPGRLSERADVMGFLPAHPSRPAAEVLARVSEAGAATSTAHLEYLLDSAIQCGPVVGLATLAVVDQVGPAQRERIAGAMFTAWDEGRLLPTDLAEPWLQGWCDELRIRSYQRQLALLIALAEANALVLAWPSLVGLAELLAAQERLPSSTGAVFEAVLRFLAEVPKEVHVELPHVVALAGRKGSSKAVKVARLIVAALKQRG